MFGITIPTAQISMDQMRFRCLAPIGTGLQVLASTVGILTVVRHEPPPNVIKIAKIILNHQQFRFNATHKTIAWRFVNNDTCTAPVSFIVQASTCEGIVNILPISSQHTLTLRSSDIQHNDDILYLSIAALDANMNHCINADFQEHFQVYPDGKLHALNN